MPKTTKRRCANCRQPFKPSNAGRPPKYCGGACRQAAYRRRVQRPHSTAVRLLDLDLAEMRFRSKVERALQNKDFRAWLERTLQKSFVQLKPRLRVVEPDD
jgi:hypothetical protein